MSLAAVSPRNRAELMRCRSRSSALTPDALSSAYFTEYVRSFFAVSIFTCPMVYRSLFVYDSQHLHYMIDAARSRYVFYYELFLQHRKILMFKCVAKLMFHIFITNEITKAFF